MPEVFHSFLKKVEGGEGDRCLYPIRLDVYGKGCETNCPYCYARSLLDFRGNWHPEEPAVASKDDVIKALKDIEPNTILRLGGMTDPFQTCEMKYGMNRWLIQELNERGIGYLIVTKNARVTECMDIMDKDLAHIQISYTHSEGLAPPDFEHASKPKERLDAIERLYHEGFDVALRLSPYIPQIVDLNQVINCDCDKVLVEFLRASAMVKKKMPWYDFSAWNQKEGSYNQLSLSAKKMLLKPLIASGKKISVCEDYTPHYRWFKENVNYDKEDCCMIRK